jgi:hypothetical protein
MSKVGLERRTCRPQMQPHQPRDPAVARHSPQFTIPTPAPHAHTPLSNEPVDPHVRVAGSEPALSLKQESLI